MACSGIPVAPFVRGRGLGKAGVWLRALTRRLRAPLSVPARSPGRRRRQGMKDLGISSEDQSPRLSQPGQKPLVITALNDLAAHEAKVEPVGLCSALRAMCSRVSAWDGQRQVEPAPTAGLGAQRHSPTQPRARLAGLKGAFKPSQPMEIRAGSSWYSTCCTRHAVLLPPGATSENGGGPRWDPAQLGQHTLMGSQWSSLQQKQHHLNHQSWRGITGC